MTNMSGTTDTKAVLVEKIRSKTTRTYEESRAAAAREARNAYRNIRFIDFIRPGENILFFGVESLEIVRATARNREALGHTGQVVVLSGTPAAVTRTCYRVAALRSIKEYIEKYDPLNTMLVFCGTLNKTVADKNVKNVYSLIGRLFSKRFSKIYIDEHIGWSDTLPYNTTVSREKLNTVLLNPSYGSSFSKYRLKEDFNHHPKEGLLIHFCALCAGAGKFEDCDFMSGYGVNFFQADDSRIAQVSLREGWEVIHLERYVHPKIASLYREISGVELEIPTSFQLLISK